jgi:lipoate-protein ligase A
LEQRVQDFFAGYQGRIIGITPDEVARAVSGACERRALIHLGFSLTESNELFLVNVSPEDLALHVPRWLLLPYCSKNLDCSWRFTPGCSECGACEIGECCELARSYGMEPVTIQSFEHLMETLATECEHHEGLYIGSCCEAFYAKHQQEMEAIHARGVLINLDSTTCYDLGKGTEAYKGHFDNKTFLNMELVRKLLACIHDAALGMGSARDRRGARRIERCG